MPDEDFDPRFTLANERTFLAWNRTALALIAGGLAVAQLLDVGSRAVRLIIAGALIAAGAGIAAWSVFHWEDNEREMRAGRPLPRSHAPRVLGFGFAAVGVLAGFAAVDHLLR